MKARVKWVGDMSFVGESGSGHAVSMDGAPQFGGRNLAPRPMEMVLLGLGGCNGFDVVKLLKEAGQDVVGVELEIEAERAVATPAVFTRIKGLYTVTGRGLDESEVKKAVAASARQRSSVSKMLEKTALITYDYEIVELGGTAESQSRDDAGG